MFDTGFFTSKLGQAALVSVAAMIMFTVFTQMQQDLGAADLLVATHATVELA